MTLRRLLREDQRRIRPNPERHGMGHSVPLLVRRHRVVRRRSGEIRAVALPIAVESQSPQATARGADRVTVEWPGREIHDDDNVIARAALIPTVKGDDLVVL